MLDEDLRVHGAADAFLQQMRFGRGCAESTTRAYATSTALYLLWCRQVHRDWRDAVDRLGAFMLWLRHAPGPGTTVGSEVARVDVVVRQPRRINAVLVAVREFIKHAVVSGDVPARALSALYEVGDDRWAPADLGGERTGLRFIARPRHRLSAPDRPVQRSSDAAAVSLLKVCRSARDRFIVVLLGRAGLRRGETVALRRADMHVGLESTSVGCDVVGEHLHVVRREEASNGAVAKSRRPRAVPLDFLVVQAYDTYCWERDRCREAFECDFVLVNLFRVPLGQPMRPGAINELLAALSRRAGLERPVHPHMLRHAFASNVLEAGGTLDEAQELLGHASPLSTQIYLHPSPARLRAAVDNIARDQVERS
ncbi:tyrosine-type recombinase/integrase [Kribbella caucasensis]|nr:tyrosine-type recombinase/integrase [Kribbella sp. VKM Ac-2527]